MLHQRKWYVIFISHNGWFISAVLYINKFFYGLQRRVNPSSHKSMPSRAGIYIGVAKKFKMAASTM